MYDTEALDSRASVSGRGALSYERSSVARLGGQKTRDYVGTSSENARQ